MMYNKFYTALKIGEDMLIEELVKISTESHEKLFQRREKSMGTLNEEQIYEAFLKEMETGTPKMGEGHIKLSDAISEYTLDLISQYYVLGFKDCLKKIGGGTSLTNLG